jgi:ribosome-binding factor A
VNGRGGKGRRRSPIGGGAARHYPRTARVNELLREVLAETLERIADHDDRLGLVTVTAVDADPDMSRARVYFAHLDDERRVALEEARVRLQAAVAAEVRLKRTPALSFASDPAISTGERVEEILRNLQESVIPEDGHGHDGD